MIKGIYLAGRSLDAKIKNITVVANNIANLNTTGFKREVPFSEVLDQFNQVRLRQATDFSQGEVVSTSNPLDLAINGNGFFVLKTDNGIELTRNGSFQVSKDGFLVNKQGFKVMGKNGEINIRDNMLQDDQMITISKLGEVKVGDIEVDSILVASLDNSMDAKRTSGLNFSLDEAELLPLQENDFEVIQGYLEESNVNPIIEMESMIRVNKEYESTQRTIAFLDQSLERANEIGKV